MLRLAPTRAFAPCRLVRSYAVSAAPSKFIPTPPAGPRPPHLLTLADLTVPQIQSLISSAIAFKKHYRNHAIPEAGRLLPGGDEGDYSGEGVKPLVAEKTLDQKTIALMFSKRSTRTRVASESAVHMLGGHPMFLGSSDIQLGVNESLYDTARVVSSMVDGIMARVGHHSEVETLAANSTVPVVNALSHLYHPTQILADLQTLLENHGPFSPYLASLHGLTVSWVGDSNNILNDMIVTYPRLGINLQIATPKGYELDKEVLERMEQGIREEDLAAGAGKLIHTHSPEEAVKGADVVTTDTWCALPSTSLQAPQLTRDLLDRISMGQEEESARRLADFSGFQITEELLKRGGAKSECLFMHCLPRHQEEVNDEVFYGKRSVVFNEAENRKWTSLAVFDAYFGKWKV